MEFIDEDSRPRFLFQSQPSSALPKPSTTISKLHALICLSSSAALILTAFSLSSYNTILFILLIWFSMSLLFAPFAPSSTAAGDLPVGRGLPLPPPQPPSQIEASRKRPPSKSNPKPILFALNPKTEEKIESEQQSEQIVSSKKEEKGEEEWTDEDFDLLKRQISKHPVGAPGRWDRIAEAFKGRHSVDSVIRSAKSLADRRPSGDDSFAQFLKHRKHVDNRADDSSVNGNGEWSSGEDIALLNALKAFPRDAAMRWEKIAVAVPGKSKAECVRRVAELKRDYRSSKNSEG